MTEITSSIQQLIDLAIANTWRRAALEVLKCRDHGNDTNWCAMGLVEEFEAYADGRAEAPAYKSLQERFSEALQLTDVVKVAVPEGYPTTVEEYKKAKGE